MSPLLLRTRKSLGRFAPLFALLSLFAAEPALSASAVWIAPPPFTLVSEPRVTVQGFLKEKPAAPPVLTVKSLESRKSVTVPVTLTEGRFFRAEVELAPGRSDLVLDDAVLSLLFAPESTAESEGKFSRAYPHKCLERGCTDCHTVWQGELALTEGFPELCLDKCHAVGTVSNRAATQRNEHSRKITSFCVGCHEVHVTRRPGLIKSEGNTCLRCHEAEQGVKSHAEAALQPCALCHDPHQSAYPSMLRGEALSLCRKCHESIAKRQIGSRSFHKPLGDGKCFTCHTPHAKTETSSALCLDCHPVVESAVHAQKLGDCIGCHDPHQSTRAALVKAGSTGKRCLSCHTDRQGVKHGDIAPDACCLCHDPHRPLNESKQDSCIGCHPATAGAHADLPMREARQCALCHDPHGPTGLPRMLYGKLHYPAKNNGCGVCHATVNGKVGLRYARAENCYRCHGATVGTSAGGTEDERIHAPVRTASCTACHDAHVAARPKMLLADPPGLCNFCHANTMPKGSVEHGAIANVGCIACHRPHISDNRPLLNAPQPNLCAECHAEKAGSKGLKSPLLHGALAEGKCSGCHEPHREDNKALIRGGADGACKRCHPKVLLNENGKPWSDLHGPVGADNCTACHVLAHEHPRDKEDRFLFVSPPRAVCPECHDVKAEHIPTKWRTRTRASAEDCLVCHDPHGAANNLMLKRMAY